MRCNMAVNTPTNNERLKFTKTETEYNMKSIRFLLLTITAMFIIIAGLMIVLGNSVYAHYHNYAFFYDSVKVGRFSTPSSLCVFLGLALILVSLFGFFGSFKMSTCMVNVYALILTLVLIMKLVVVILAFTMDADTILKYVVFPMWDYPDPEVTAEMDYIQSTLGCCGKDSYLDYTSMNFHNYTTTVVVSNTIDGDLVTMEIPASCCVAETDGYCTRMWSGGCASALVSLLAQNAIVIGVLGVSVMFINLLGIIFALLLARCIRKLKSERALALWKVKEQVILARQAEETTKKQENQVYIPHADSSIA